MSAALKPTVVASPRIVRLALIFGHCRPFQALAKSSSRSAHDEPCQHADARLRIEAPQVLGSAGHALLLVPLDLAPGQYRRDPRRCEPFEPGQRGHEWATIFRLGKPSSSTSVAPLPDLHRAKASVAAEAEAPLVLGRLKPGKSNDIFSEGASVPCEWCKEAAASAPGGRAPAPGAGIPGTRGTLRVGSSTRSLYGCARVLRAQ